MCFNGSRLKRASQEPVSKESVEPAFRRARDSVRVTEDQALNAICDARLREPRLPLDKLLKKLEHELER